MRKLPIIVNYILIAAAIGIFAAIAMPLFLYPYKVNWAEGNMFFQVQKILDHKSLYTQPSIYYVPWLYEPIYYYASVFITKLAELSFVSIRIIPLLSTNDI